MRLVASRARRIDPAPPGRPSLLLALTDEAGAVGLGEASPLPPFSREDLDACARALDDVHERLAPLDDEAPAAEAISFALQRMEPALAAAPSARFALETALLDLLARRRGLSVATLLGGARSYGAVHANALLAADPPEILAD